MNETHFLPRERILIIGAGGQVGRALFDCFKGHPHCESWTRKEFDLAGPIEDHLGKLDVLRPTLVLNAAAFTQVDRAESERDLAIKVNADAPGAIAQWCFEHQATFVHYSTDYVFSGSSGHSWQESDPVAPVNAYGATKLQGEERILEAAGKYPNSRYLIFRTSWIFDSIGKNFFLTMLRLAQEKEVIRVVSDQHGSPTYAPDLAFATLEALENSFGQREFPSGIYHLCGGGQTTWHEFASAIVEGSRSYGMPIKVQKVEPIPSGDHPTPARRPENSCLNTQLAMERLGVHLRDWKDGLADCMRLYFQSGAQT